jgi:hypothetical protein
MSCLKLSGVWCGWFLVLCLVDVMGSRLSNAADEVTNRDLLKLRLALNRQTIVQPFEMQGPHPEAWATSAKEFLERMVVRISENPYSQVYRSGTVSSNSEMLQRVMDLQKAGCNDPLVMYFAGMILNDSGQTTEYQESLRTNTPLLLSSTYPAFRKYFAACRYSNDLKAKSGEKKSTIRWRSVCTWSQRFPSL